MIAVNEPVTIENQWCEIYSFQELLALTRSQENNGFELIIDKRFPANNEEGTICGLLAAELVFKPKFRDPDDRFFIRLI